MHHGSIVGARRVLDFLKRRVVIGLGPSPANYVNQFRRHSTGQFLSVCISFASFFLERTFLMYFQYDLLFV